MQYKDSITIKVYSRLADAKRVTKRLRDHGVLVGMRKYVHQNEIFGYLPDGKTLEDIRALADKLYAEA